MSLRTDPPAGAAPDPMSAGTPWIHRLASPIGPLELAADLDGALVYLGFARPGREGLRTGLDQARAGRDAAPRLTGDPALLEPVRRQLDEYFRGARRDFELPLALRGTPFQLRVWAELRRIPYGQTLSYGELARRLGNPGLCRAVGAANGANPVSIIVPCHRVIGSGGGLTGYGGGLEAKQALLALERPPEPGWLFPD